MVVVEREVCSCVGMSIFEGGWVSVVVVGLCFGVVGGGCNGLKLVRWVLLFLGLRVPVKVEMLGAGVAWMFAV